MGNATTTEPAQGFDPKIADIFRNKGNNTTNTLNATTPLYNETTYVTTLPTHDHSQGNVPIGAVAGAIVGGLILILLITALILRRRRQRVVAPPQPPPELAATPFNPYELPEGGLYELQHDPRVLYELYHDSRRFELPAPIDLNRSVREKTIG